MEWEQATALTSALITGAIGLLTYLRGRRSDEALNVATNIKTTFDAQAQLIDALQEEIATQRGWLHACEESCRECRRQLEERTRLFHALEREFANLKALAFEQEQTIARHERTLTSISRRSDHSPQATRADGEERRDPPEQPKDGGPDEPANS